MEPIPRRVSVVEQVVEILRENLRQGRWPEHLPAEHQLSDLLQVSRSTLRQGLAILRREGLVSVAQGRRWRPMRSAAKRLPMPSKAVAMISSLPLWEQSWHSVVIFDELRRHLQRAGFELQIHVVAQSEKRTGGAQLEQLLAQTHAACWILSSCSAQLQQRFLHHPVPTIVLGSCHRGVELPFFRLDVAAACRHAVGVLHRNGHRRIGMLLPRSAFAGALEVEESFLEACAAQPDLFDEPLVRYHESDVAAVERAVGSLMRCRARPTALIAMMPTDALTIHCHLLKQGLRIPGQISLVSLLDDLYLTRVTPALGRYGYNHAAFARRLGQLVLKMARLGTCPPSLSIFPDFIVGATVGRSPDASSVNRT